MHRKRLLALVLLLLCTAVLSFASAGETTALPDEVTALCAVQYPGYTIAASAGGGSASQGQMALFLKKGGHNVLVIAEKQADDAGYAFTVETDKAVLQGDAIPSLLIDSAGDVLFYTYQETTRNLDQNIDYTYRYHTEKTQSGWGDVDITVIREYIQKTDYDVYKRHKEITLSLQAVDFVITESFYNEYETPVRQIRYSPLYTPWLQDSLRLSAFDITAWPFEHPGDTDAQSLLIQMLDWSPAVFSELNARSALAVLPGGYSIIRTTLTPSALMAEVTDAQGMRRLALITSEADGTHRITQSPPMHEGVTLDFTHAWDSIGIRVYPDFDVKENYSVNGFLRRADGLWRLRGVMADDIFSYTAFGIDYDFDTWLVGDYPAMELGTIDWEALPTSLAQAMETLDQSGWARVISDDPQNRLHLRAAARRDANSLGKYYQGTPVRVLSRNGDWTEVDIFGVQGYMMTKWLAFGADMNGVENAFPQQTYQEDQLKAGIGLYASPADKQPFAALQFANDLPDPIILGVIGDEWYHILFPDTGLSGYIRQDMLWPGNG